ncbi:MAG: sugar ABC transporter permease [Caldilineaceae bacterium]|nr:sugar ABC transporter permease [Caldilineaceae bacterium]
MSDAVVPGKTTSAERAIAADTMPQAHRGILTGRQRRRLREALLAYLFLLPAFAIVGLFGLFPLVFAAYESTLRGLNKVVGTYDGLGNYLKAIDSLTYLLGFWGAVGLVYLAARAIWQGRTQAAKKDEPFGVWSLSGVPLGAALLFALALIIRLLPLLLSIPDQMRGAQNTPENFRRLLGEALSSSGVVEMWWAALAALAIGLLPLFLVPRLLKRSDRRLGYYASSFVAGTMLLGLAAALFWLTWSELQNQLAEAANGAGLDLWTQIIMISAGFMLFFLSWVLWRSASHRATNRSTLLRLAAAAMLMVAAWMLVAEVPRAIAAGDKVWWDGLLATLYYSLGTIPVQLLLGLLLAVLLFQDIKGRSFFRVIYFLPYIAPFVGTAAVFKIIFSSRPTAPLNSMLGFLGLPALQWINEPAGILNVLTPGLQLPSWSAGPSLALIVIVIFGAWTFFGFNTVVFLAGLGNIPKEMYEAAAIDGAGRWAQFRNITLPLLSPTIYFLTLYSVIGTFKAFNHIYVLRTGAALGTTDTASVVIFQAFKRDTRYGYASALAILLLLIIIILTVVNNRIASRRVHYG